MQRRTRILATIGPASRAPEVLEALIAAGLDAVRLNFSHGTHPLHAETVQRVREAAERLGRPVAILQDLQGPKIRLGKLEAPVTFDRGARVTVTTRDVIGKGPLLPTDFASLPTDVRPGMRLLFDEGRVSAVVRSIEQTEVHCEIDDGGTLSSDKGLSVPGAALTTAAMTDKDATDVRFGLDLGVDFVALSFVRRAGDVAALRSLMRAHGRVVPIVAKIERPEAVEAIDEIVAEAEGVMVARGDLGIESALDMLPAHQKRIIASANRAGKLVITATQMLESMTENELPTRAEVTDVANAVLDGTDAVMLSGETAVGKHPVEAVRRMGSIAATTEATLYPFERPVRPSPSAAEHEAPDAFPRVATRLAAQAARELGAKAIAVVTRSGDLAERLSDERPSAPIIALTPDVSVARRLALYWGVRPFVVDEVLASGRAAAHARFLLERGIAAGGDKVVLLRGMDGPGSRAHAVELLILGEGEQR